MAGGLGSHLAYRESNLSIYVYTALLRYMSILFLNVLTLLAPTQSADNRFHSFTVLFLSLYVCQAMSSVFDGIVCIGLIHAL